MTLHAVYAALVGIIMPLVADIEPIYRALSKSLRDALDLAHHTFSEVSIRMVRLEKLGLEPWQTSTALMLIVIGFVVYYVIPYSFTFGDFPLFFSILNFILLGMLLGLCITLFPLESRLEHLILWCVLWGKDRRMMPLIRKNMAGHRKRTGKTAVMFTICMSFMYGGAAATHLWRLP